MSNKNNEGYEYEIVNEPQGRFIEVFRTDKQGKRTEMHLAIYVNTPDGETDDAAVKAASVELFDAEFCASANLEGDELKRQRAAMKWLSEAYVSVNDIKKI